MKQITKRQQEVLSFISEFTAENSFPPTMREISSHFGITPHAIQGHINALQKKGYLVQTQKRSSRAIKVLVNEHDTKPLMVQVPLLGTVVTAGKPILCDENFDGYVTISEPFIKPGKNYFALRVRGASMIGAGILEGDLAIMEKAVSATDGQIVVAVIDDAITFKRYYRESSRIRLQPENPEFKPIYCQEVRIVGVLSGIVRMY